MSSMTSRFSCCMTAVLFLVTLLLKETDAAVYRVGDEGVWTNFDILASRAPNYSEWASGISFRVGDQLVFYFAPTYHNVYSLPSLEAYENCDFQHATLLDAGSFGTYTWLATRGGTYYFSCDKTVEGMGTHCEQGQKFSIVVKQAGASASPSPAPAVRSPLPSPSVNSPVLTPSLNSPAVTPSIAPVANATSPVSPSTPGLSPSYRSPTLSPSLSPSHSPTVSPAPTAPNVSSPAPRVTPGSAPANAPALSPPAPPLATSPSSTSTTPVVSPPAPPMAGSSPTSSAPSASPPDTFETSAPESPVMETPVNDASRGRFQATSFSFIVSTIALMAII